MTFLNPITSLPASAITGQIDPATQIAPGTLAAGILLNAADLQGLIPTTQLSGQITTGQISANAIGTNQLAAGAVTAAKIAAGTITTTQLSATAIDGMTITGALFRTAATGQRIEIDSPTFADRIRFWPNSNPGTNPLELRVDTVGTLGIGPSNLSGNYFEVNGATGVVIGNAGALPLSVNGDIVASGVSTSEIRIQEGRLVLGKNSGGGNVRNIDFLYGSPTGGNTYDVRLQANGGTFGTDGQGVLNVLAANLQHGGQNVVRATGGGSDKVSGSATSAAFNGASPSVSTGTVNFGHTFASAPVVVAVCSPLTGNTTTVLNITSISTTGFSYRLALTAGTSSSTVTIWYVALGG